ncbi:MAG: hypothetical protein ACXVBE_16985 [Bdellovibrionota bacterium]
MKFMLIAAFTLLAQNAFAADIPVPAQAAKPLFEALSEAFPEAVQTRKHSAQVFVVDLACEASGEGGRCKGEILEGKKLALEAGEELSKLWFALKTAEIPMKDFQGGEPAQVLNLEYLTCDQHIFANGVSTYACVYKLND